MLPSFHHRSRMSWAVAMGALVTAATGSCVPGDSVDTAGEARPPIAFDLPYVHFTLDNGLEVVPKHFVN